MSLTVTDTSSTSTATSLTSGQSAEEISNMWLSLLVTQLENQDPLDPMDAEEMTSQLTQISILEQASLTNETLATVISQLSFMDTATVMEMAGDTMTVYGSQSPMQDGEVSWYYDLAADATDVTLTVTDADGNEVYSVQTSGSAGANPFTWDGMTADGEQLTDGIYTLSVEAQNASGEDVDYEVRFEAEVTDVDVTGSTPILGADGVAFYTSSIATRRA